MEKQIGAWSCLWATEQKTGSESTERQTASTGVQGEKQRAGAEAAYKAGETAVHPGPEA